MEDLKKLEENEGETRLKFVTLKFGDGHILSGFS